MSSYIEFLPTSFQYNVANFPELGSDPTFTQDTDTISDDNCYIHSQEFIDDAYDFITEDELFAQKIVDNDITPFGQFYWSRWYPPNQNKSYHTKFTYNTQFDCIISNPPYPKP